MKSCKPEKIIESVPNVQSVLLPIEWFKNIPNNQSVFESLYQWMLTEGHVTSVDQNSIHNKTFVGNATHKKLCSAEKKRLRKKHNLKGDKLDFQVSFSDSGSGPMNEIGGIPISGDVILVIPESSTEHLNEFARELHKSTQAKEVESFRRKAAGGNFFEWLASQKNRPDHIGDLVNDAVADKDFPRSGTFFEEFRKYFDHINACSDAMQCLKDAWLEYSQKYPERIEPQAWCSLCCQRVSPESAFFVYEEEDAGCYFVDQQCVERLSDPAHLNTLPLNQITELALEEFAESAGISQYEIDEVSTTLKLWGIFQVEDKPGIVYFIQNDETKQIKIGYTAGTVQSRIQQLQTGQPHSLTVLATVNGTMNYEKSLHHRFRHFRLRGEWFSPNPELSSFIESVR